MSTQLPLPLRAPVLVPFLVLADQLSKFLVEYYLPFQSKVDLIPFLAMFRTYNEGIAFSWFSDLNDWVLVAITLAIIAFVFWLWRQTEPNRWLSLLGFAFVMGGAIGNLIDRVWFGYVIDFILVHTETWSFAVFNLADSFINLGAGFIIFDEILSMIRNKKNKPEGPAQ